MPLLGHAKVAEKEPSLFVVTGEIGLLEAVGASITLERVAKLIGLILRADAGNRDIGTDRAGDRAVAWPGHDNLERIIAGAGLGNTEVVVTSPAAAARRPTAA